MARLVVARLLRCGVRIRLRRRGGGRLFGLESLSLSRKFLKSRLGHSANLSRLGSCYLLERPRPLEPGRLKIQLQKKSHDDNDEQESAEPIAISPTCRLALVHGRITLSVVANP
jgi:hypothetical protein